jgi:chromosome segregation ATPase
MRGGSEMFGFRRKTRELIDDLIVDFRSLRDEVERRVDSEILLRQQTETRMDRRITDLGKLKGQMDDLMKAVDTLDIGRQRQEDAMKCTNAAADANSELVAMNKVEIAKLSKARKNMAGDIYRIKQEQASLTNIGDDNFNEIEKLKKEIKGLKNSADLAKNNAAKLVSRVDESIAGVTKYAGVKATKAAITKTIDAAFSVFELDARDSFKRCNERITAIELSDRTLREMTGMLTRQVQAVNPHGLTIEKFSADPALKVAEINAIAASVAEAKATETPDTQPTPQPSP